MEKKNYMEKNKVKKIIRVTNNLPEKKKELQTGDKKKDSLSIKYPYFLNLILSFSPLTIGKKQVYNSLKSLEKKIKSYIGS